MSFSRTRIETEVSSVVVALSATACGASLTTLTVTIALLFPPRPSLTSYLKLSSPENPESGVYITRLFTLTWVVPCFADPNSRSDTLKLSLSGSLSLASTSITTSWFTRVSLVSFFATGGLLGISLTVIKTFAVALLSLSVNSYSKLSVPRKSFFGK